MKTVEWTDKAMANFRHIARYITLAFGRRTTEKFEKNIAEWETRIVRNPCIGLREPLMAERPEGFRSVVVHRNCKLVYYVDGDTVYIADVWDIETASWSIMLMAIQCILPMCGTLAASLSFKLTT